MSGTFIVFEGGDGAGKSTQLALLGRWLADRGREVVRTREPGGTELGVEIRRLVQHTESDVAPRAEALLYAADRAQHVAHLVRPALARGAVVLQDRYLYSSVAYQGAGRELDAGEIRGLSEWASGGLLPDRVVLLDLEPAAGRDRLMARADAQYDRLEQTDGDFAARVRRAYLDLAAREPERFAVIDAGGAPAEVHARVLSAVRALIEDGGTLSGPSERLQP